MGGPWEDFQSAPQAAPPVAVDGPWNDFGPSKPGITSITVRPNNAIAPPDQPQPGYAEDAAKGFVGGLEKGAIGLAGIAGDAGNLVNTGMDAATQAISGILGHPVTLDDIRQAVARRVKGRELAPGEPLVPAMHVAGSQELRQGVEGVSGPLYDAKTVPGQYAQTVGEFIPGAAAGGGGAAGLVRYGVVPAIASETAGQATKGTGIEPYARVAGGLAAGVGAGALAQPAVAERVLARQLPNYVTDAHVTQAQSLINDATQRGINLTWPEALTAVTGQPVLTDMQRVLESSPRTRAAMQTAIGDRAGQINTSARNMIDTIAPPTATPATIGGAVGQAAEGAVNDVRGVINRASEPYYQAAQSAFLSPADMARVRAIPGFEGASNAVRGDPQLNRNVAHLPDNNVGFLNEVKKYLDQQAENAGRPMAQDPNMQRVAGLRQDATAVRDAAQNASVDYSTALALQSHLRDRYLQPLLDGPLGRLANRDITTGKAISELFPEKPNAGSQEEVRTAVTALAHRSPEAARQLVRAHVEAKLNEAFEATGRGPEAAQWAGGNFAKGLVGSPVIDGQKMQNFRAAVESLPNGHQVWPGIERFVDIARATAVRQSIGSKTAFNVQELGGLETGSAVGNLVKTAASPGKWLSFVGDKWRNWQQGQNLNELAGLITDPRAAPVFQRLSRIDPGSREAISLAGRLMTIANTAQNSARDRQNKR